MRLSPLVAVAGLMLVNGPADSEQERVDGMGRTRGWVVATDGGDLAFVDCQGHRSVLGTARVEPSAHRCPTSPTPLQVVGVVQSVDPVRRIVRAQEDTGRLHAFHVTTDVPWPADLKPGQRITVTGPIDGHATGITIP